MNGENRRERWIELQKIPGQLGRSTIAETQFRQSGGMASERGL
jgi:hypothetical protein